MDNAGRNFLLSINLKNTGKSLKNCDKYETQCKGLSTWLKQNPQSPVLGKLSKEEKNNQVGYAFIRMERIIGTLDKLFAMSNITATVKYLTDYHNKGVLISDYKYSQINDFNVKDIFSKDYTYRCEVEVPVVHHYYNKEKQAEL